MLQYAVSDHLVIVGMSLLVHTQAVFGDGRIENGGFVVLWLSGDPVQAK